jgi:hypothetical protein
MRTSKWLSSRPRTNGTKHFCDNSFVINVSRPFFPGKVRPQCNKTLQKRTAEHSAHMSDLCQPNPQYKRATRDRSVLTPTTRRHERLETRNPRARYSLTRARARRGLWSTRTSQSFPAHARPCRNLSQFSDFPALFVLRREPRTNKRLAAIRRTSDEAKSVIIHLAYYGASGTMTSNAFCFMHLHKLLASGIMHALENCVRMARNTGRQSAGRDQANSTRGRWILQFVDNRATRQATKT